jgi:integrase
MFARPDGELRGNDDYRNGRKRAFVPAANAAGLNEPRPYDLRHSFVSLPITEGVSIVEVARQAGHSPEECLRTYLHTFEAFDPADRQPTEVVIAAARCPKDDSDVHVISARADEARTGR